MSRELWQGLVRFNRTQAGPLKYTRIVLSARDSKGGLLGGLILQSYWRESHIELLWLSARARGVGIGSRLIHLNTFSFQAPGFYQKQGYRCFGGMSGSPKGHSRHFYVKQLRAMERRRAR